MYPETVCLSRSKGDELTILLEKRRKNTMQSRRTAEATEFRDLMARLQHEALDLSTKRPTPHESSNTSPASPPHLKRRRVLWSSELGDSWKSSNHSADGTHPPAHADSADDVDTANTGNVAQSHLLESFAVCSSVGDGGLLRSETNVLGLTQRRMPSLDDSSSLDVTMPPLEAVIPPVTQPTPPDIPLVLARHSLSTAAAAAAVVGVDSHLRGIPANRSVTTTADSFSLQPPSVALPVGEYAPVAVVPYASSSSSSSSSSSPYFQAFLRRPRSNATRANQSSSEASRSPRRPIQSSTDWRRRADDYESTVAPPPPPPRSEEIRDVGYLERRRKNNESAKRSRDARRQKEEETAFRAAELERENLSLRAELLLLRRESAEMHHLLYAITDLPRR